MVMIRAFLALVAGFAAMMIAGGVVIALPRHFVPEWTSERVRPPSGYVVVHLASLFLAAALGGYITAWLSFANPLIHTLALALVVLLLSARSAMQNRGKQPIWFLLTFFPLTPIGVFAGGVLRLHIVGIL